MGFWATYFSTLFKGTRMISFKQRWNARKVINNLRKADNLLFTKMDQDVNVDHRVTAAIKEQKEVLIELNYAAEGAFALLFQSEVQEHNLINAIQEVRTAISKLKVTDAPLIAHETKVIRAIVDALKKADDEDRDEYKDFLALIKEEEAGSLALRQVVRQRFQSLGSQQQIAALFTKLAARSEARITARAIVVLRTLAGNIKALQRASQKDISNKLPGLLDSAKLNVQRAYFETIALKKRAIQWMMKILYDLYILEGKGKVWVKQSYMPQSSIAAGLVKIKKIEGELLKDCRILAQGLLNMINYIEKTEKDLIEVESQIKTGSFN